MPNFNPAQPARFISGMTQAMPFQPLAGMGMPDPFFVALYEDDFIPYNSAIYTLTGTGSSAAAVAGPGGQLQLTAANVANDSAVLQLGTVGQYAIQSTNHLWYGCRLVPNAINGPGWVAGLCNFGATFGGITDGLYFSVAEGANTLTFNSVVGSASTGSVTVPFTPTTGTFFDLAFEYQAFSTIGANVAVYAGANLWGNKSGLQNTANLGPIARLQATSYTAVNLTPTLMVATGTTTSYNLVVDFQMAALER